MKGPRISGGPCLPVEVNPWCGGRRDALHSSVLPVRVDKLPVMDEVAEEAARREIELVICRPTGRAIEER